MVTQFLGGKTYFKMGHRIDFIYDHHQSQPPIDTEERHRAFFDQTLRPDTCFACPALSSWALLLVAKEGHKQVGDLTNNDPTDPTDTTQIVPWYLTEMMSAPTMAVTTRQCCAQAPGALFGLPPAPLQCQLVGSPLVGPAQNFIDCCVGVPIVSNLGEPGFSCVRDISTFTEGKK
ncbi:hypothetical protein B0H19DRAFT_1077836 [Mycena capillaripes]|nr:hypothetical protein B0H19DRAFT_1077836 [Mycena capillaripes]